MTTRQATAKADRLCWVDENWDLVNASDRVSRYGAYLRGHTELFDPWQDAPGGISRDAGEFAIAALQVATGPIMSPGYLRWHPRVLDYKVSHGENPEPGRLVCQVTLATSPSLWLGSPWWSWTTYLGRGWCWPSWTAVTSGERPARPGDLKLARPRRPAPLHLRPPWRRGPGAGPPGS